MRREATIGAVLDEPLLKFLELCRVRLGADDVHAELGGREPSGAGVLSCSLRPHVRVVAVFDAPPLDTSRLQERLDSLVAAYSGYLSDEPGGDRSLSIDIQTPQPAASLELALHGLAERTGAIRALVVDEQSPIVWGTSHPNALPTDIGTATSLAHTATALDRVGLDIATLLTTASGDTEAALTQSALSPAEKRGISGVLSSLMEVGALKTRVEWAHDVLAARAVVATRRQRDVSLVREPPLGVVAKGFANIYRLLLVFEGRFSPLQAEAAIIQAVPLIEGLVTRLPPVDPSPGGGKVVALRSR